MAGIPDFMEKFNNFKVVHRKVDWLNPQLNCLNSLPVKVLLSGTYHLTSPLVDLDICCDPGVFVWFDVADFPADDPRPDNVVVTSDI